jgi:DNA-binding phage protein
MPLSRDFKETVRERAHTDPDFRFTMLQEALSALDLGEAFEAKILLRDFINATIGFQALGEAVDRDPKALMRMFSPKGNPTLENLSLVLKELAEREGYSIKVERRASRPAHPAKRPRRSKAAA